MKALEFFLVFSVAVATVAASTIKIDPQVLKRARLVGNADIIIQMSRNEIHRVHEHAKSLVGADHHTRSEELHIDLKGYTEKVQKTVMAKLTERKTSAMKIVQLWGANLISVKNIPLETMKEMAEMSEVMAIREDRRFPIEAVRDLKITSFSARNVNIMANQWNIERVGAPSIWSYQNITGDGIIVGSIDSGVRVSHTCLQGKFVQDCFWDSYGQSDIPIDNNGHGTHTIGTMVADCGVGVAPGAKFCSCRACGDTECTESALYECGQWMIYPTNANGTYMPHCRPHIINNSWGGPSGDKFYYNVTTAWDAAGIVPIFSCGNNGACSSISDPGGYDNVKCAAATDIFDRLAPFSSRGPGLDGSSKPDISAPGVDILSAYMMDDNSGAYMSGTSMASPHVAGVAALMLDTVYRHTDRKNVTPSCALRLAYAMIEKTAQPARFNGSISCGGVSDNAMPTNPFFGYGICNIKEAFAKYQDLNFDALC